MPCLGGTPRHLQGSLILVGIFLALSTSEIDVGRLGLRKNFSLENSIAKFDFSTLFMRVKIAGTKTGASYSSIFGPLFFLPRCSPNQAVISVGRPIFIFDPMILYDFFDNWIHFIHFTVAIMIISTSYCFFFSSLFSELIFSPK